MYQTDVIIEKLKRETQSNPVSSAVFHVMATRERSRNNLTLNGLTQSMEANGFVNYDQKDYIPVLRFLNELGIGKLDIGPNGEVRGLRDIMWSLPTIGLAACGGKPELKTFRPRKKYMKLPSGGKNESVEPPFVSKEKPKAKVIDISLTLSINGKPIKVTVPKDLNVEEIAGLIDSFQGNQAG